MMATPVETVEESLSRARFEVLPLRDAAEQTDWLPVGTTVTVTASPRRGMEPTIELAGTLAGRGMRAVPHVAARLITSRQHLSRVLRRLAEADIEEVFVVAGDSPSPAGPFPDALALLDGMDGSGLRPSRIGIAGYPERHPLIPDEATIRAMAAKSEHADYIVTQMCFAPETTARWIADVRSRGIELPVHIGVPGAIEVTKLLRVSLRIGIGDSMRFLRNQHGVVSKMFGRYSPDGILGALSPYVTDPRYGIAGWHLFTFNEIPATVRWRDRAATRTQEVSA